MNIYEIKHRILLKKYVLSNNRSLDGILYKLNNKNIVDNVNLNEIDQFTDSEYEERFFLFITFKIKTNIFNIHFFIEKIK